MCPSENAQYSLLLHKCISAPSKTPSDGINFDEMFGNLESCPKSLNIFKTYANGGSSAHGNLVVLII